MREKETRQDGRLGYRLPELLFGKRPRGRGSGGAETRASSPQRRRRRSKPGGVAGRQWIASVGTDSQPTFRRIYNPARHQERFDPDNGYVRRYMPELRAVPDDYIREPWTMPPEVQRDAGCVIGDRYPAPIIDHRRAREEAMARYRVGRSEDG